MDKKYTFEDLKDIVKKLRGENGCPWDKEQTHQSIKHNIIEEGYELIEMLDSENWEKVADESGDLLLQIVFHAQIGEENGEYGLDDVCDAVCRKLIHRHPHVFGELKLENSEQVLDEWNKIKRDDRGQKTVAQEMAGVSKALPALMRAEKIQGKAEKGGYVFSDPITTSESVSSMMNVMVGVTEQKIAEMYVGKMLFEAVSIAKKMGVDAETALNRRIEAFIQEYTKYEG